MLLADFSKDTHDGDDVAGDTHDGDVVAGDDITHVYGASCYIMRGKVLQRNVLPLFVLRTRILCPVVIPSIVVDFQYGFGHNIGQIIIN